MLWEENAQDKRSIASITKVMTTVVFLEDNPDLIAGGHRRAQRRLRRVDDLSAAPTTGSRSTTCCTSCSSRPTTPRRACSRALSHGGTAVVRRADEREGARARPREHVVRRSVRPQSRQRLVRLRSVAADLVRGGGRAHRADHADRRRITVSTNRRDDQRSTARTGSCAAGTST